MITRVAVGTDGSPTAAKAVEMAVEMAQRFDAELVLLSAAGGSAPAQAADGPDETHWSFSPAARLHEILARTEDEITGGGLACRTVIEEGDPAEVLVRLASECEADVLVIGNKGIHRRVLGSVPNTVTHHAPCSVLVVKTT